MSVQKKIACVNDISGIGKCSLTVALPIISALKSQCCPITTAVLSSQTGYPKYTFRDLSDDLDDYIDVLDKLEKKFDIIYSGFLGSKNQISKVKKLIKNNSSFVVVDPVLGDNGRRFSIFDDDFLVEMKSLVSSADLITPNITEANILLDRKIDFFDYNRDELKKICIDLSNMGPNLVIITGFVKDNKIQNISYDKISDKMDIISVDYNSVSFSGTGDIFTSIITGLIARNYSLKDSVKIATKFISDAVEFTTKQNFYDRNDGILFEFFLDKLINL